MKFYRQETSRILAFLQFLSTTCVTLLCSRGNLVQHKRVDSSASTGDGLSGKGFRGGRVVENLRTSEEKRLSPADLSAQNRLRDD